MKPNPATSYSALVALVNDLPSAADGAIQIPYGWFPHAVALQKFDRAAAEAMVANFANTKAKLGERFSGAPIYVGHPDSPDWVKKQAAGLVDKKAYGWIMNIRAEADGLYLEPTWNEPGKQLVEQKQFKFYSPVWNAKDGGRKNGQQIAIPTTFISLGLTNEPNIPVLPLTNEGTNDEQAERISSIRQWHKDRRNPYHLYGL